MVTVAQPPVTHERLRQLQSLGILCGFGAGAWLGAAEAPTKLVTLGISPVVISLLMVAGVFLARWSVPALIRGTGQVSWDLRQAPHLVVWAVLAGCLWAVANTLTIFAIRDVGLSIAFPLWNMNSLIGIFWGVTLFNELRNAGIRRWLSVLGGAALMFAGATPSCLCIVVPNHSTTCNARHHRRVGRGCPVGNDVRALPQSVSHRHESAVVRYVLYRRRTRDHDDHRSHLQRRRSRL